MTTTSEKAPGACKAGLDSATSVRYHKDIQTQIAKLALAGHAVREGANKDFLVSKWGMSKHCSDFAELVAFSKILGVH